MTADQEQVQKTKSVNRAAWSNWVPLCEAPARLPAAVHGVYEIGIKEGEWYVPKYLGRAWGESQPLKERFSRHCRDSHNPEIKERANQERLALKKDPKAHILFCRWIQVKERESAWKGESFLSAYSSAAELNKAYPWTKRHEWKGYFGENLSLPRFAPNPPKRNPAVAQANELWWEHQRQSRQSRVNASRAAARQTIPGASKSNPAARGAAIFLLALELARFVVQVVEAFKEPDVGNAKLSANLKMKLDQLQKAEEAEGRMLIPVLKVKVRPDDVIRAEPKDVFERNEQRIADFESMFWWEFVSVERDDYAERANLADITRLSASIIAKNLFPDLARLLQCPYEDGSFDGLRWVTDLLSIQQTFVKVSEQASKEYLEMFSKARAQWSDK